MTASPVATIDASIAAAGINVPSMAMLAKMAKIPPAGVKPPYMKD